jgi:hypothetical protein
MRTMSPKLCGFQADEGEGLEATMWNNMVETCLLEVCHWFISTSSTYTNSGSLMLIPELDQPLEISKIKLQRVLSVFPPSSFNDCHKKTPPWMSYLDNMKHYPWSHSSEPQDFGRSQSKIYTGENSYMKFTANPSGVDAPVVDGGSTLVKDRHSPFLLFQKKEDTGFTSRSYSPFRTMMRMEWYLNSRRLVNFSHDVTRVFFGSYRCEWTKCTPHTHFSTRKFSSSPTTCNVNSTTICTFQPLCLVAGMVDMWWTAIFFLVIYNKQALLYTTLNNSVTVGYRNFQEPTLILNEDYCGPD